MIVAGGTGGHLAPGLALAARFAVENTLFLTLPENQQAVTLYGLPDAVTVENYPAPSLKRGLRDLVLLPFRMLRALYRFRKIFRKFQPHFVVGLGGYPALPALLYCRFFSVPYFLCEQNAVPGRITRLFTSRARAIFFHLPVARPPAHSRVMGNPVRSSIEERAAEVAAGRAGRSSAEKPTILVLGGSQGSAQINDLILHALPLLEVRWLFQCGESQLEPVRRRLPRPEGEDLTVFGFHPDPASLYSKADLLICRSGAGVLSEALLFGLPMLLIPYPFASDDHQKANAEVLVAAGAARMLYGETIDPALFVDLLRSMLEDRPALLSMSRAALSLARPGAAADIAAHIRSMMA